MKTGYTEAAGKCLVATAERDGVRLGRDRAQLPEPRHAGQRLLNEGSRRLPPPAGARTANAARSLSRARATLRARSEYRSLEWIDWPVSQRRRHVDLDDTPEQAAYRAKVRSWLEENESRHRVLQGPGALEEEAEIIAARRAWQGKLAEGGLAGVTWPKEYGGQGLGPNRAGHLQPGDRPREGAWDPRRDRRRHARPDDHRPRHRRAEGALPRPDAPRRRGLVPALLRARRGLGPRGRPDRARASRTTAAGG